MSYYFYVADSRPLNIHQVLRETGDDRILISGEAEEIAEYKDFEPGKAYTFYIPGESTRGAIAKLEGEQYSCFINVTATYMDCWIAVMLAAAIGRQLGRDIRPEGQRLPVTPEQLLNEFAPSWAEQESEFGFDTIFSMLEREAGPLTVYGYNRPVHLGQNLMAELGAGKLSQQEVKQNLIRKMMEIQELDTMGYYESKLFRTDPEDGKQMTMTIVGPSIHYLLPASDYVMIGWGDKQYKKVSRSHFLSCVKDKVQMIDEIQFFMRGLTEKQIIAIAESAV